jgi:caffeoyl-CoA O-methyltransferase
MITNFEIEAYIQENLPDRPTEFLIAEQYAKENNFPIVGPMVGSFLYLITKLSNPKKILELGSGFGYSAAWFAFASSETCSIICTDADEKNINKANELFEKKPFWSKINFFQGDALEESENIDEQYDIIFCDIDKWEYPNAFDEHIEKLRIGGCFIFDNTLWGAKVLNATSDQDTVAIQELNRTLAGSNNFYSMIYPIRDGVTVAYKIR